MSFVVTNTKVYKEFDSILEAESFISKSQEVGLEVYERDLFGNLRKLGDLEIGQLATKEKTLNPNQNQQKEYEQKQTNYPTKQKTENNPQEEQGNTQQGISQEQKERNENKEKTNPANPAQTLLINVKYNNGEEKTPPDTPFVRIIKITLLLLIFGFLAYLIIFIIWPMLADVITTMSSPPSVSV